MQTCCPFKSAVRKLLIALNTHNLKCPLWSSAEVYGCKTQ
jgi:hypothetical protein